MISCQKMKHIISIWVLINYAITASCTDHEKSVNIKKMCHDAYTCQECVRTHPECAWCAEPSFSGRRCSTELQKEGCPVSDIQDPANNFTEIKSEELRDSIDPVQIKPQHVELRSRLGFKSRIKVQVRVSTDIPTDIYFLMDLSKSMSDIVKTMTSTIKDIALDMKTITNDLHIGVGAFVDKPVIPYVPTNFKKRFCRRDDCGVSYGFRNVVKLTSKETTFSESLDNLLVSVSVDSPEGTTDGLMQATVCKSEIGWRNKSRRFIILMTDAQPHIAFDGKLGGIAMPNDGKCHLNSSGFYTGSLNMDYPSLGQVHEALLLANIIPIFAIAEPKQDQPDCLDVYEKLTKTFFEGSTVARLKDSSATIMNLVKENFKKITAEVKMIDTSPQSVKTTYRTSCGKNAPMIKTQKCVGVAPGQTVEFDVDIYVDGCVEGRQEFIIKSVGIDDELLVTVDPICTCDCQKHTIVNNSHCSNQGNLTCGLCHCNEKSFGEFCQCDVTDIENEDDDGGECISSENEEICSGVGSCICGRCVCHTEGGVSRYSGKYCECDDMSCSPDCVNGACKCGVCQCQEGYNGPTCSCQMGLCPSCEHNNLTCNDHGKCDCGGKCRCDPDYSGPMCQECDLCVSKDRCNDNIECIKCIVRDGSRCEHECKDFQIITDNRTLSKDLVLTCMKHDEIVGVIPCENDDDQKCKFDYNITADNKRQYIIFGECTELKRTNNETLLIVIIVICSLLGCLLPLFIWRVVVYFYDYMEYNNFVSELNQTNDMVMGENKLYNRPITSVKNPTFETK